MSAVDLERIEALIMELRQELLKRGATPLPTLLTLPMAARELSVGMTKLRELIASNVVLTVTELGREKVPRSEIERLSQVEPPKVALRGEAKRLAGSLAKLRGATLGAQALKLRVRDTKRPRSLTGGTQDSDALRKRRR